MDATFGYLDANSSHLDATFGYLDARRVKSGKSKPEVTAKSKESQLQGKEYCVHTAVSNKLKLCFNSCHFQILIMIGPVGAQPKIEDILFTVVLNPCFTI